MKKNFRKRIGVLTLTLALAAMLLPGFAVKAEALTKDGFEVSITNVVCDGCTDKSVHEFAITDFTVNRDVPNQAVVTITVSYKDHNGQAYTATGSGNVHIENCEETIGNKVQIVTQGESDWVTARVNYLGNAPHQGSATCAAAANCTVCGKSYTEDHIPTGEWICDEAAKTHYKACATPGCTARLSETDCNYDVATCTAASTCSVCGHEYAPIDETNHHYNAYSYDGTHHWLLCSRNADHIGEKTPCTLARDYEQPHGSKSVIIKEYCDGCGYSGYVSIDVYDSTYTGSAIEFAVIEYFPTWKGAQDIAPVYQNNVNVGTASCTVDSVTMTVSINPAKLAAEMVTVNSGTYNGAAHTPVVKLTFNGKDLVEGTDYTLSAWSGDLTGAGTYTATVTGQGNFKDTCTVSYTIEKADPVYTAPAAISDLTYTGQPQTLITSGNVAGLDMKYSLDNATWSGDLPQATDAGKHTVYWSIEGNENYNGANGTVEVTVAKAEAVYTAPAANTLTYTGEAQALVTAGSSEHGTFQYRLEGQETYSAAIPTGTNAGTYSVYWKLTGDSNYLDAEGKVKLTIQRADLPADLTFAYTEPADLVYDGTAKSVTVTPSLAGLTADDITVLYSADPVNAGSYTFEIKVARSQNYKASTQVFEDEAWKFTIAKATPTLLWNQSEYTYTGRPQGVVTVGLTNGEQFAGTIAYSHQKGTEESVSGMPTNVGTYTLTVSVPEKENYTAVTGTHTMTIKPKAVTVTLVLADDTLTYDGTAKEPAVKVMAAGNQLPAAEYTVTYADNTAVGAATATVKAKEGGNYTFDDTDAVFLILPDTSALDGVTTANVKATHQEAIDAIQAAMSGTTVTGASTAAQAEWNAIVKKCADLEDQIHKAAAAKEDIADGAAALPAQPTTDDYEDIKDLVDAYEDVEGNLTSAEKKALEDEMELLQDHLEELEEVLDALEEITDGTAALDEDDLDYADKATINTLQAKIEALEDNDYLTDEDLKALEDAGDTLADLEAEFTEADQVTTLLNALPTTADPDSKTAIDAYAAARKAYDDLGADKSKVDPAAVKKLTDLYTELTDYAIIKVSATRWYKTSGKELTFTANGYYPNFIGVKVDGLLIDSSNYTSKSGSTIVTLKSSYLEKLATGSHTISICFGGELAGDAESTFRIDTYLVSPATGDTSNIQFWTILASLSLLGAAAVVVLLLKKRKK